MRHIKTRKGCNAKVQRYAFGALVCGTGGIHVSLVTYAIYLWPCRTHTNTSTEENAEIVANAKENDL